ncbi:Ig-like domain-containing protein, partial [Acinetobacter gerneri]|uniref:Ig-like domain-containing protein n=1 Tax=Acinetobacter gerneri TaxID=202952 RepID=UPI00054EB7D5
HVDVPEITENGASLSGTGEAGSTIIVTDVDGNTSTTVVDENGHWTFPENPLTEGEVGSIEAIDTNGNESGQAPVVGGDQHVDVPEITENGTSLSGTGEAGSTISVTDADGNTSTTVVDENGHWTFPENPLTEGEVGSIEAIDTNGNESGQAPVVGGDQHVDVPEITENGTSLSGTGEAGSTIIVTDADGNTSTTVVDENGHWTFPENPLTEGELGTIEAIDTNGNESGEVELIGGDQHVDIPEITENGTSLSGTGEAGSTIIVTDADGNTSTTVVDENGNWTFPENPLTEGEVGSIEAIDTNGNESGEVELIGGDQHVDVPEITENGTSLSGTG